MWVRSGPKGSRLTCIASAGCRGAGRQAEKAARCRQLMAVARTPEIVEQLRLWADEFEAMGQAFRLRPEPLTGNPIESGAVEVTPTSIIRPKMEGMA